MIVLKNCTKSFGKVKGQGKERKEIIVFFSLSIELEDKMS